MVELKEKISPLERRGGYQVSPTTTSATLGSYSQPAFGVKGSGLVAHVSPQPGREMSGLGTRQVLTPPSVGRSMIARVGRTSPGSISSNSTPSPGTGLGLGALAPGQRVGAPAANTGQAQGPGRAIDVEGAGHAPGASTVTTGASSTTTNQGPAQAGSHLPPQ